MLYATLPGHKLSLMDLLKFVFRVARSDLLVLRFGVVGSLLGLVSQS